jgi:two-component sensor histidine kinase
VPSSLRSRLALLLVLANLPAAALAIGATVIGRDAETAQREHAILQRAELIATRAGLTLGIAEGVADTLAANLAVASGSRDCRAQLERALGSRPEYTGMLVSGPDGRTVCSAGDARISEESQSSLMRAIQNTQNIGDAVFLPETIPAEDDVVLLSRAFTAPTGERRAIGLLLRRNIFDSIFLPTDPDETEIGALALIRGNGVVVSEFIKGQQDWRPSEPLPVGKPDERASGLTFPTRDGVGFHYAIAPVRGTLSSVVLATPVSVLAATDWMRFAAAIGAPLLMLLLGIFSVFVGVDHLVLRWISRFRQVAGAYARGDYTPRIAGLEKAPLEFAELGGAINHMAERVRERSVAAQDALEGKNGLLRELHHRVKNNFQMIASLLALQRRELPQRLRMLLRVPEDRVLAMAAAYKASYSTGEIGLVSTADLLRDIASQLRQSFGVAAPAIRIEAGEDPIWLDLDQAVPLGLLVSEILSAAMERVDSENSPVTVKLSIPETGLVHIEIASERIANIVPSTGLAARLVSAYRTQVNATLTLPSDDIVLIEMPLQSDSISSPGRVELGA